MALSDDAPGLFAISSFVPGDKVFSCKPWVWSFQYSNHYTVCAGCFEETGSLKMCQNCQFYRYCNRECQKIGWDADHKHECAMFQNVKKAAAAAKLDRHKCERPKCGEFGCFVAEIIAAKIVFKISMECKKEGVGADCILALITSWPYDQRYEENQLFQLPAESVQKLLWPADQITNIPNFDFLVRKIYFNILPIKQAQKSVIVGGGIYPQALHRSMTPVCWNTNVTMHFEGHKLVMVAAESIPKFTTLADIRQNELLDTVYEATLNQRRKQFSIFCFGSCACGRCTDKYDAEINRLKCITASCKERIPSHENACATCPRCGASNETRYLKLHKLIQEYEIVSAEQLNLVKFLSRQDEIRLQLGTLLQPDAHFNLVCGRNFIKLDDTVCLDQLDTYFKFCRGIMPCVRKVFPAVHQGRANWLTTGASVAKRFFSRKYEAEPIAAVNSLVAEVLPEVLQWAVESRQIYFHLMSNLDIHRHHDYLTNTVASIRQILDDLDRQGYVLGSFLNTKMEFIADGRSLSEFDAMVVIGENGIGNQRVLPRFQVVNSAIKSATEVDAAADRYPVVIHLPEGNELGVNRLVYASTGPLNRDYDDARRYEEAAFDGVKRALAPGARNPFVYIDVDEKLNSCPVYGQAELVSVLGALRALYVPLEIREAEGKKATKADRIAFHMGNTNRMAGPSVEKMAHALEAGRIVTRDIGGSDPERMASPRVAEYIKETFSGVNEIKIEYITDQKKLENEFPLLGAVNRAASVIDRHHANVMILEYVGEGPITENVFLVGKGITYDTGGADVKAGGVMAGMHRDKCGAAAVAGFFKTLSILKPKGIRVVGSMSMVRNSIGENCYVADEIITSRAGVRVRVGNTDAEGRMVMADLLCYMKERIVKEGIHNNSQIYTIATLTGHAVLAMGPQYSAVLDNGPARVAGTSRALFDLGGRIAEPVELSTIRREDYEFHKGKSEYEEVLQCNNLPSSRTPRGHQSPAAFMILASGMDKHGIDSPAPIPYTHIDIAGSSGPFPGVPTGTPLLALAMRHVLPHLF